MDFETQKAIREAMAKGAGEAMIGPPVSQDALKGLELFAAPGTRYKGTEAWQMMLNLGVVMESDFYVAHKIRDSKVYRWIMADHRWMETESLIELGMLVDRHWRIVPDPAEPEAKPTPCTWAREFLMGIRDQINKFLEASQ
jgi:hypothetical protein